MYSGGHRFLDYRGYLIDIELALALAFGKDDGKSMYHAEWQDDGIVISSQFLRTGTDRFPTQASLRSYLYRKLKDMPREIRERVAGPVTDQDIQLDYGKPLTADGFRITTYRPKEYSRTFLVTPAWVA